jgi:acetyltransferase
MIAKLAIYPILTGARGRETVNLDKLAETVLAISQLGENFPQISLLDINPLIVNQQSTIAVDIKITLEKA